MYYLTADLDGGKKKKKKKKAWATKKKIKHRVLIYEICFSIEKSSY